MTGFPSGELTTNDLAWITAGFFGVLVLALSIKLSRKPKRYISKRYVTEMPAKLVIEEDSAS